MSVKKVGELLVACELITKEELDEALDLQKLFPSQQVGQLLCKLGYIHESDLSSSLDQMDKHLKLGVVLIAMGLIDQEKLINAFDLSERNRITIRKAILQLKYVDDENLAKAVASQYDMPYIQINSQDLSLDLSSYITEVYARQRRIVPISKIGNTLTLAMIKPLNPVSAIFVFILPSYVNGFVTIPTVRTPASFATSAITGAAPVPVPPPIPAAIKRRSVPLRQPINCERDSKAASLPISGLVPAPSPLVS